MKKPHVLAPSVLCAGALLAAAPAAAAPLDIAFGPTPDQQIRFTPLAIARDLEITIPLPDRVRSLDSLTLTILGDFGLSNENAAVFFDGAPVGAILNGDTTDDPFDFDIEGFNVSAFDYRVTSSTTTALPTPSATGTFTLAFDPSPLVQVDGSELGFINRPAPFDQIPDDFAYAVAGVLTVDVGDDLAWIAPAGGAWDDPANWSLGKAPIVEDGADISPALSQTIAGPAGLADLHGMTLGAGAGVATLAMQGGAIAAEVGATIAENGRLTGAGTLAGAVENRGEIAGDGLVFENDVENAGLLGGDVRIRGRLDNLETGEIEVGAGETLAVDGIGNLNAGEIQILGGKLDLRNDLFNLETGRIVARDAEIEAGGAVTNFGDVTFLGGGNLIDGAFANSGRVVNSGNGNLAFLDLVNNGGEIRTSGVGATVFLGDYIGAGSLTGGGSVFFEGNVSTGASPALVAFANDVFLTNADTTTMELAGLARGTGYDAWDVSGTLTLGGALDIVALGGFLANPGDRFTLFMASEILGDFASVSFPDLASGRFRTFRTDTAFGVEAVPLPAAGWMLIAGLGALAALRRSAA